MSENSAGAAPQVWIGLANAKFYLTKKPDFKRDIFVVKNNRSIFSVACPTSNTILRPLAEPLLIRVFSKG